MAKHNSDDETAAAALSAEARAKLAQAHAAYLEMQAPDSDGMTFTEATSQAIAYERMLESSRRTDDRLFHDHLAEHLVGEKGEMCSEFVNATLGHHTGIEDVHVKYTAARTRLINDHVDEWIDRRTSSDDGGGRVQVACLGAGVDTRAFWLESLGKVERYVEVDVDVVNSFKARKLDKLKAQALCERQVITMDFSKESIRDMPKHGFDASMPTCWILEGLVMYLKKDEVIKLLGEMTDLSVGGSYLILNYINGPEGTAGNVDYMSKLLVERGWSNEKRLNFGDVDFNYGRFPEGRDPITSMGFTFYDME